MVDVHSEEYILGQNIRKYRIQKGWSQADLSLAMDVDRADISKYENGSKGLMSCSMLRRFAKALGVSMDALMEEEEDERGTTESIQEKFERLNPLHQAMIVETIDAYIEKEKRTSQEKPIAIAI